MKLNLIIPALLLGAWAVSAGACSQEQRALACAAAKAALVVAENHGTSAEEITRLRADVEILCALLSPAELQRVDEAVVMAVPEAADTMEN